MVCFTSQRPAGNTLGALNARAEHNNTMLFVNPDDDIRTCDGLCLPAAAFAWRFDRAGGPGGQHRNKVHTRATAHVNLELLTGPPALVILVRDRLGPSLSISEGVARSQWRNRVRVVERITDALEKAARPERRRRATRPTRNAIEARLETKRRTAQRKKDRGLTRNDE